MPNMDVVKMGVIIGSATNWLVDSSLGTKEFELKFDTTNINY
jgi:hypothetical protein